MPYDVGKDPYRDKNTGILRNLLGIATEDKLQEAEAQITSVQISTLIVDHQYAPDEVTWDLLCTIHHFIFSDIFDWAGQPRTIELSKGKTSFARVDHITSSAAEIFKRLAKEDYLIGLGKDEFVQRLAHYYSELNILHPFREGNGRAVRTLLTMLGGSIGWNIAWDKMSAKQNIAACIAAYHDDERPLREMLEDIIEPVDIFWGQDPYEYIS
jgi:cell filamentation protein